MEVKRIMMLPDFMGFYEGLSDGEQRQVDYSLYWIDMESKFPIPIVKVPANFGNLFEIHVPAEELDLRIMSFYTSINRSLYLTHGFVFDEKTNPVVEYIRAEKIKEDHQRP